jgi:hypothetical protein
MDVEGIILVLSCQKHRYTRLINLNLNKHSYNNWKVIKVIGKPFMKKISVVFKIYLQII